MLGPRLPLAVLGFLMLWPAAAPMQDRAEAVLRAARQAVGGEAQLRAVKSLTLSGSVTSDLHAIVGGTLSPTLRRLTSDLQVDVVLPDTFLVTQNWATAFMRRVGGFRGDRLVERRRYQGVWTDSTADVAADELQRHLKVRRRELLRYLAVWLLATPEQFDVQVKYLGEAVAPNTTADAIEATGANDFSARLFFDRKTHLLVMMTYQEPPIPARVSLDEPKPRSNRDMPFVGIDGPATESEVKMQFSDHVKVAGLLFPRRVNVDMGEVLEEWTFSKVKVNDRIDLTEFEKK